MSGASAAKSYARALFELAVEKDLVGALTAELVVFQEAWNHSVDLKVFLNSKLISVRDKREVLNSLSLKIQLNDLTKNFLCLLADKGRFPIFLGICKEYGFLVDERNGLVRGTLVTAEVVAPEQVKELESAFSKKMGRSVVLQSSIDKSILGGLIVRIRDLTFDGSIRTSLTRLKNDLERQYV